MRKFFVIVSQRLRFQYITAGDGKAAENTAVKNIDEEMQELQTAARTETGHSEVKFLE